MTELTFEQLKKFLQKNSEVETWYEVFSQLLPEYEINTPQRIAAFLAQCYHESMGFTVLKENLNYRAESLRLVFPKYFPNNAIAREYASKPNKQEAIANRVYANRMGNGDEKSGDGYRYRGRGVIQLTGKDNYSRFAESVSMSLDEAVDYLQTYEGAAHSACWFWDVNKLNNYADKGEFVTLTKRINGGVNGLEDRTKHYKRALKIMSA